MSFLTNFGAWNQLLDLKVQYYKLIWPSSITWRSKHDQYSGYSEIFFTSGQLVTCGMSLLANCVAQNLFMVSIMTFYTSVTLTILLTFTLHIECIHEYQRTKGKYNLWISDPILTCDMSFFTNCRVTLNPFLASIMSLQALVTLQTSLCDL